jgi:YYY domain-containing protein
LKIVIRWQPLALFGIAFLGLALRLYGLDWDQIQARSQLLLRLYGVDFAQGNNFHPDERQILFHVVQLSWPKSLAQFLDPATSPLNPHFFAYGSFPLYLLATVGNILSHISPTLANFANLTLTGRFMNALFDAGTILLTGWLGLMLTNDRTPGRRYAWSVALLAAALVAFTPLQVQLSHFYTVDTMLLFFVTLTILACVALVDTDKPVRWSLIAGLGYGLALATKFSAAPLAVPLIVALAMRWYRQGIFSIVKPLIYSFCVTLVTFLVAMPYALLDLREFIQQVSDQGSLARGMLDLPYVRQFAGTTPFIYQAQNMLLWGMGLTLGLAAIAGFLWLCWRIWKRNAGPWLVVLSWVLVYGAITGSFYVKFMRYMLPLYPFLTLMAASVLIAFVRYSRERTKKGNAIVLSLVKILPYIAVVVVILGTMFQGLALLNIYSQPNTRIQASRWIFDHLKPGSVLTYEQWDDALPFAIDNHDASIYQQASYVDANGQPQQGLDLYGDDTVAKAQQLAKILPGVDAITMASDRLDKSIPRLPCRYPLTIHYYQLLFSGQLGFHLAAQFENHPNLLGITLNDSGADESYSVFDHPTSRIFVRDNPYPFTSDQLFHKLLQGVQLPPSCASLSGAQHSLLLSAQQIADNQQSPPFGTQFPANSFSNSFPILIWWFMLMLLGVLAYPLVFSAFHGLTDRGYIFSKTLGILLLAYCTWILACLHLIAFSHVSTLIVIAMLLVLAIALVVWQRRTIKAFLLQRWRLLLIEEAIFTLAFLLFVFIRTLNPELWNVNFGGEKPMELAFLNAVLRSPYMPPYDPWFAGGYINYYYYGYVIFGACIKLTGIMPGVAFNLAIPTLFALTFTGVVTLVYSFARSFPIALLGGYFAALIGNFDGLLLLKDQFFALLAKVRIPIFDYWRSSRIIPFTINEFPFWSFLFADLHPHVIDLPIAVLMLGVMGSLLLANDERDGTSGERRAGNALLYLLAAFTFGTIACVNPWDMPVYALLLGIVLILRKLQAQRGKLKREMFFSLGFTLISVAFLCGLGYLFYWPFYATYQQLYVNGLGLVSRGTGLSDYLTISGLWIFITLSFFLFEFYHWWMRKQNSRARAPGKNSLAIGGSTTRNIAGYLLLCGIIVTITALFGPKILLTLLIGFGMFLFVVRMREAWFNRALTRSPPTFLAEDDAIVLASLTSTDGAHHKIVARTNTFDIGDRFTYILLLVGLCISLGLEIVYVRDFLDGGDYERMNTVFKFSVQAWLCFAIGGALAVHRLWSLLRGTVRKVWVVLFFLLLLGGSVFLVGGTTSRIGDHQIWVAAQPPVQSANYTPTLNGLAFIQAWYPGDARAIAWLNENVAGSPVILEAAAPVSYQWFNRVSIYTGLPDVLGWADHVGEQRYSDQPLNRMIDIGIIYTTPDEVQAITLLRYYHVRYIYVGDLERQAYAQQSTVGLDKFNRMVGDTPRVVYRADGVTIYEVM